MRRRPSIRVAGALAVLGAILVTAPPPAAAAPSDSVPAARSADRGPLSHAKAIVSTLTVSEQAASVIMGHIPTTDPAVLRSYMQGGLGGFILMGANIPESEEALRGVTDALGARSSLPPLIAVDQEGGGVSRLAWDSFPAAGSLKSAAPESTGRAFAARAALVARAGANVNFGVVADVAPDASSFIFWRSFGAEPAAAASRVTAAVSAEEPLIASTLKHFPGHGAAPGDSHRVVPATAMTLEQWRAADAVPFAAGIEAGARMLMFGHLAYTAVDAAPASLSPRWHDIARTELGFDGVMVTDDLGMLQSTGIPAYADPVANAVAALAAGNDLVLAIAHSTPETPAQMVAGITAAVESGALPADRLQDAAERVLALRLELAASGSSGWTICPDCAPAG